MQRQHLDQLLHSKHSCSDIFCQSNRADADVLPCKRILLLKVKVFTKSYRIQLHKKLSHVRSSFRVETSIARGISAFPTSLKKDKNVARYQCRVVKSDIRIIFHVFSLGHPRNPLRELKVELDQLDSG